MTVQYGPWIAFNDGDTPPADDVIVQVQLAGETRLQVEAESESLTSLANKFNWCAATTASTIIAYRVVNQPVRGEVTFNGSLHDYFSLHPQNDYRNTDKPARVTFTTADGLLIPGAYTGPDGATIKIEVVK